VLGARQSWDVGATFLSAPFEESGWEGALRDMARHTNSSHGELIGIDSANSIALNWAPDLPPEFFSEFVEIDGGDPRRNWRVACVAPPLQIISEAQYREVRESHPGQYDIYDDFAHRHGLVHGCQTVLLNEGGSFFGLAALRTFEDGPTTAEDRQAFAEVAPYVLNAVRLQRSLEHQGAAMVAGALEQMKAAAILCDGAGRVCAITAAAEERLRSSYRLILRDGRIFAARADEDRLLGEAMTRALNGGASQGAVARFWLRGEAGHLDSEICEVFALPRREWSLGFEPRVLIVLRWPNRVGGENRELIQELWNLSAAEAAIALLLAQGLSRDQIAESRATSPATVHSQLKSLFLKVGVSRESELVAVLGKVARLIGN
jgi:DNA-binding CsgD family transcriptional regulator